MGKKAKDQGDEMSKEDKAKRKMMEAVAKHLRFKVPIKSAVIKGQKIEYFQGDKAVDCLMESKWTREPSDKHDSLVPYFETRTNAIDYCSRLLQNQFFIRVNKVEVKKPKGEEQQSTVTSSSKESEGSSLRKRGEKTTDSPRAKKGDSSEGDASKKRKKKYRLEIHHQQIFCDTSDDVYFWQYDPPSHGTYLIGAGVVIGAIALTMQPLWPDSTRVGMWYLSMGVFVLMGAMVTLIVGRWFLYGLSLMVTLGKVKFWIFPNLDNEKLGFVESFKPFYSIEYKDAAKGSKGKKKKKDKGTSSKSSGDSGQSAEADDRGEKEDVDDQEEEKLDEAPDDENGEGMKDDEEETTQTEQITT